MKRLLAAGMPRIFQITRAYRAGERGRLHNPEFTMLEWYTTGQDYRGLMDDTETLVRSAAEAVAAAGIETRAAVWPPSFPRRTVDEIFRSHAGWVPSEAWDADRFFRDLVDRVEPALTLRPALFLLDFPAPVASLARLSGNNRRVAERCELYLEGLEISNGFSELTDHREQRERFERANRERRELGKEPYPVDEGFLEDLQRLPDCAGNALGVDRLLMALAGAVSIDEVTAFGRGERGDHGRE